ncbi:unnamed protein product [Darwinula stevensoni]|uniref:Uncharacterized protein n=1 Tax=Darwinula stevensoni TaxID=69355 RepID=A0A7R9AHT4_9CRUS|nr:unnamed protein product [Darwinula stevensoni]CAG0905684.1 unnamed protein product [Darwinula stevensoni]
MQSVLENDAAKLGTTLSKRKVTAMERELGEFGAADRFASESKDFRVRAIKNRGREGGIGVPLRPGRPGVRVRLPWHFTRSRLLGRGRREFECGKRYESRPYRDEFHEIIETSEMQCMEMDGAMPGPSPAQAFFSPSPLGLDSPGGGPSPYSISPLHSPPSSSKPMFFYNPTRILSDNTNVPLKSDPDEPTRSEAPRRSEAPGRTEATKEEVKQEIGKSAEDSNDSVLEIVKLDDTLDTFSQSGSLSCVMSTAIRSEFGGGTQPPADGARDPRPPPQLNAAELARLLELKKANQALDSPIDGSKHLMVRFPVSSFRPPSLRCSV